ncbi:Hypothetical protein, predicted transmembrane protein [Mycoplasma yeatsii 13926]|uniref:Transmembrane protein n=1 Tax=Mycoplasma yeatsii 13926 TaxID=1188240 RepID=S6G8R9_9MOLU|nr:hypothetical protein [Mycoplasma yeatsii]EOA07190.1 Hypothetical protein, predicted transmembrane protein [Mycoplasma yeatsii 13926]
MNTNQDNKNLILGGSIFSLITGFGFFIFLTFALIGNSIILWWLLIPGIKIVVFLAWLLNVASMVLTILSLVPATSSKKPIVMTAGILNIVFGTIVGGVLLLIGASNINVNNNTNQLNSNNQENIQPVNVQVENKPVKKVQKTKEVEVNNTEVNEFNISFKKCKMLNFTPFMIIGLIFSIVASVLSTGIVIYGLWPISSYFNSGPFVAKIFVIDKILFILFNITTIALCIVILSTIKKDLLMLQILVAIFSMAIWMIGRSIVIVHAGDVFGRSFGAPFITIFSWIGSVSISISIIGNRINKFIKQRTNCKNNN